MDFNSNDTYTDPAQQDYVLGYRKSSWLFAGIAIIVISSLLAYVLTPWLLVLLVPGIGCLAVSGKLDALYHMCCPARIRS